MKYLSLLLLPFLVAADAAYNCYCPPDAAAPAPTPVPDASVPPVTWKKPLLVKWDISLSVLPKLTNPAKVLDFDGFDMSASLISSLKSAGKYVICYFSAGSAEEWRPDYSKFKSTDLGNGLDGWAGERWVNITSANVRAIMAARADLAKNKGCDAIDWDNVDEYTHKNSGFSFTGAQQLDYNKYLAGLAHTRGMAVLLKNDVEQVVALQPYFDGTVNEECVNYSECGTLKPFTDAGKPVYSITYGGSSTATRYCPTLNALKFSAIIKNYNLDSFVIQCTP